MTGTSTLPFTMMLVGVLCAYIHPVIIVAILAGADGGDRSAQELRDMAREKRLRSGEEAAGIGGFEKYTKVMHCVTLVCAYVQ